MAETTDSTNVLSNYFEIFQQDCRSRCVRGIESLNGVDPVTIGHNQWNKSCDNNHKGLAETAEGCDTTKWRLSEKQSKQDN